MIPTLLIAVGNPLRRDDGVAHLVLEQLGNKCDVEFRALLQLTPEIAQDIAGYGAVIFIDSDACVRDLSIEPLAQPPSTPVLTHVSNPAEIVSLARGLFGFSGRVFLCRIPVDDLSVGEGLSPRATSFAEEAVRRLEILLGDL